MIVASILVYFLFSLFFTIFVYGRLNFAKFVQNLFLITFGLNILIYQGLDLFKAIDHSVLFLFIQIVICILLSLLIRHKWPLTIREYGDRLKISLSNLKWFDFSLVFLMGAILSAFFVVGITTPPNNLDSLDPTGITRIFYWMQQKSITADIFQNLPSIFDSKFVHIQGLWLFSLGKSEYLFFLVQWFSLVLATATIYKISRSLSFSVTNSLFSSLVGLSLPVVLMQTYSFQGDLTVAALFLVFVSLIIDWLLSKSKVDLFAAVLSLILTFGSKKAAFLVIPTLGLFILVWIIARIKNKKIIPWLAGSLAIILIAAIIGVGQVFFQHGGVLAGMPLISDSQISATTISEKIQYNSSRFIYQFVGLDGLPRVVQNSLIPIKTKLFSERLIPPSLDLQKEAYLQPGYNETEKFFYASPLILSEDGAWFGPLGFLLIPIALILSFFSKQKNRRLYSLFGLVLFFSFFVMVIIQRPGWDPYQGRYFILPILPLIPLISILLPTKKLWRTMLIVLILPLSLFLSINTFLANNSKPIITAGNIWGFQYQHVLTLPENNKYERYLKNKLITNLDHIAEAALDRRPINQCSYWDQVYYSSFDRLVDIRFIDPLIPDGATLYLNIPSTALDYGLFGKNKDRTLIRVEVINQVPSGYFLTSQPLITPAKNVELIGDNGVHQVYLIKTQ